MSSVPTKNLFVDANVFLGFYHFSNDDLDELQKLVGLIKKGEVVLYATTQVIDEVDRNRDVKIQDAYKKFRENDYKSSFPQMCKGYAEYETIRRALRAAESARAELDKKLSADIASRSLKADETISELLGLAHVVDSTGLTDVAYKRYIAGNPPGKNNSYGDALTWEALLHDVPDGQDLFFVSDDKDYKSPLGSELFNSYLEKEWTTKKSSKICYYPRLSSFFSEHHKEIALQQEAEKRKWILALSASGSFAETHLVVSKLSKMDEFSDEEIREIVAAALSNDQVYSIMTDADLARFFGGILTNKGDELSDDTRNELSRLLSTGEETQTEETIPDF